MVNQPSQALISNITYIHTKKGFLYLTTTTVLYDRKIIGGSLIDSMSTNEKTTLTSLKMAIKTRIYKLV